MFGCVYLYQNDVNIQISICRSNNCINENKFKEKLRWLPIATSLHLLFLNLQQTETSCANIPLIPVS